MGDPQLAEKVNKNVAFNVYNSNTDRPTNSTVDNNKSLSKINYFERKSEDYAFPSIVSHRLQNPKDLTVGSLKELIKKILTYACSPRN